LNSSKNNLSKNLFFLKKKKIRKKIIHIHSLPHEQPTPQSIEPMKVVDHHPTQLTIGTYLVSTPPTIAQPHPSSTSVGVVSHRLA
jgi:hypothetical protein